MNLKRLEEESVVDLAPYMAQVVEDLKRDKKHPAVHTYTCTLHSFMKFSGGKGMPMPIKEVFTPGRLKEYELWMKQKELSLNSISTYMRTLRAVYNRLVPPGSADYNPKLFDDVYTKVESQTKRALTERQIGKLVCTDFSTLPQELKSVLAYFLLMFLFRGMPFIDLVHLRKKDIRGNKIVYSRHKTGRQITLCIPKEALPLIKEYKDRNADYIYLFPVLDARVKDDWEMYKCYQNALSNFNKALVTVAKILLPGVKISSYTARHTWATLAFHIGMPIGIISQALGHSSIRTTETYLKPFENEKVDEANSKLISSVRRCKKGNSALFTSL